MTLLPGLGGEACPERRRGVGGAEGELAARREPEGGPPAWAADYVGIPFRARGRDRSGCDCYGLVALVLREIFAIEVPAYDSDYADALDRAEVAALIAGEIESRWRSVARIAGTEAGATKEDMRSLSTVAPASLPVSFAGDAILLRIAGQPWHVGVVVAPGWFLHIRPGTDSCLERYDSLRWARRIMGCYRYVG